MHEIGCFHRFQTFLSTEPQEQFENARKLLQCRDNAGIHRRCRLAIHAANQ